MITRERQNDIVSLIQHLDITPAMFRKAEEEYCRLAKYLEDNDLDAEIYPHGSFILGTVIRPIMRNLSAGYDLDFICQVKRKKHTCTAEALRDEIETLLQSNPDYRNNLLVYDACFTICFPAVDGYGFSIDVVPAVDESESKKCKLKNESMRPDLIDNSIAIPNLEDGHYSWLTNNPRGYRTWFFETNEEFAFFTRSEYRRRLWAENSAVYASVEDVPTELERSPLQRVIQILKFHRDVFYSKLKGAVPGKDHPLKPHSGIIGTLVVTIAQSANRQMDTFELLKFVLDELRIYSELLQINTVEFRTKHINRNLISKDGDKWIMRNPANPEDNLVNSWNEHSQAAPTFFNWLQNVVYDLLESLECDDSMFRARISGAFGDDFVRSIWGRKYEKNPATVIKPESQARPWLKK